MKLYLLAASALKRIEAILLYLCSSKITLEMPSIAFKLTCFIFLMSLLLIHYIKGQLTFFTFLETRNFYRFFYCLFFGFFFHKNVPTQCGGPAAKHYSAACLLAFPPCCSGLGEGVARVKMRTVMETETDSERGRKENGGAVNDSLPPTSRLMPSLSLSNGRLPSNPLP